MMPTGPTFEPLLRFWFAPETQQKWYGGGPGFDAELRERFGALHADAAAGRLSGWAETPHGALALVVLFDQVSRNIYRDTPGMFAHDAAALRIVRQCLPRAVDVALTLPERSIFYMPLMHAEQIAAQTLACQLFTKLGGPTELYFARLHYAVVERFGRFPHRNAILGRESTPEETAYLAQGGLRF
jgi:uncharacterized protein (DUF924 family)